MIATVYRSVAEGYRYGLIVMLMLASVYAGAVVGAWISDDEIPTIISAATVSTPATAGESAVVLFLVKRERNCSVTASQQVTDAAGVRYVLDTIEAESPGTLGASSIKHAIALPADMAPGRAVYSLRRTFRCNPWQRLVKPLLSPPIEVGFDVRRPQ